MRKKILFLAVFGFPLLWLIPLQAATETAGPINVSAKIPSGLTFEMTIIDQLTNAQVPSMDFGELVRSGNEFRAARFFKVYLSVNVAGDPYDLTQAGTPLTHSQGQDTLPSGTYMLKPQYVEADNGGDSQPVGSSVGITDTAVGTKQIFSDSTGSSRVITCTYTLSGDPNTGAKNTIPLSQKSGAYSGTIQFTLTTS